MHQLARVEVRTKSPTTIPSVNCPRVRFSRGIYILIYYNEKIINQTVLIELIRFLFIYFLHRYIIFTRIYYGFISADECCLNNKLGLTERK